MSSTLVLGLFFYKKKINLKIMIKSNNIRIVVAMSGGVDSSVAAALLKKRGFDVVGIFMKFWKDGQSLDNRCCSIESEKLARLVAKKLDIPFYVLNVEKEFKKKVVDYFLKEYKAGNTPNPCVVCNKEIKFGFLINKALTLGADYVATGHYAQQQSFASVRLFCAKDTEKDQTYFLCQLNQKQLKHVLFPVGNYKKSEVRKLAKKFDLPVAETKESQEVCFIPDTTDNFLKKYLKTKPGKVIDEKGNILGEHEGLWFYTIGQRKGIGLSGGPYYVIGKDLKDNALIISKNQKDLLKKELFVKNVNWLSGKKPKLPLKIKVRIRYRNKLAEATIDKKYKITFAKPQRAITPGQSAVFYKGEELLGGGVIR